MRKISLLITLLLLAACSPKYDWRDYRSPDAPFAALFPGKPATHSRVVDLDGQSVKMTMTASQVDSTIFAIGSAEIPDATLAPKALAAMKTALVRNIGGAIKEEKGTSSVNASDGKVAQDASIEVEAIGLQNGVPMLLVGRFVAHGQRIYQVIVMGKEKTVAREQVDMFMSSFKLN